MNPSFLFRKFKYFNKELSKNNIKSKINEKIMDEFNE